MIEAYLTRIGLPGSAADWGPEAGTARLADLAAAHLATVPFENLALHEGEPAQVDPGAVLAKIVTRHRGGICYEINGALGTLLAGLGWEVAFHAGRVTRSPGLQLPLGHLALLVRAPDTARGQQPWVVDAGFGGDLVAGPVEDVLPGFAAGAGEEVPAVRPDGTPVGYHLERRSRDLTDFTGMAWWHSTSPLARFTGALICSVTRDGIRHTLSGRHLKISAGEQVLQDRTLADETEVLAVYRDTFGIVLDREPRTTTGLRRH